MDCLGALGHNLYNKLCYGVHEAGNDHEIRFHSVEPMCVEWAAQGQPTVLFLGLLKNNLDWLELDQKRPCVVCMKLFEMNGLSWLIKEINRLMLDMLR